MTAAAEAVPAALSHAAGIDLAAYRADHVAERVRRAVEREGVRDVHELARLLASDPAARSRFRRSIAVSVSGMFRDPHQFDFLERELLPGLLSRASRLRVWSAGCADGSELYSVAIVLDRLGALERSFLLGSDLLEENIEAARRGVYGETQIPAALRHRVRWERRDLIREGAPQGKWHLVICRNVAIYLAPEAKRALYRALAASLTTGGVLLLGRSERLADSGGMALERVGACAYRKVR